MKYNVTEYFVKKALKNGVPNDINQLVLSTGRPEHEVTQTLIEMFPDIHGTPGLNTPYRTSATIEELILYAKSMVENNGIDWLINFKYYPNPCGCLGPINDEPLCPCNMKNELFKNKTLLVDHFKKV